MENNIDKLVAKLKLVGEDIVEHSDKGVLAINKNGQIYLYNKSNGFQAKHYNSYKRIGIDYIECLDDDNNADVLDIGLSIVDTLNNERVLDVLFNRYIVAKSIHGNRIRLKLIGGIGVIDGPLITCRGFIGKLNKTPVRIIMVVDSGYNTKVYRDEAYGKLKKIIECDITSTVYFTVSEVIMVNRYGIRVVDYNNRLKLKASSKGALVTLECNNTVAVIKEYNNIIYKANIIKV